MSRSLRPARPSGWWRFCAPRTRGVRLGALNSPSTPASEAARLKALRALALLDTPPEERFDRITRLASRLFNAPVSLISLCDERRQWLKSRVGVGAKLEIARADSFCTHTIEQQGTLVVEDTMRDPRFVNVPLVTGPTAIRFYAGQRLVDAAGLSLGTLCIMDRHARSFSEHDHDMLVNLSAMAEQELASQQTISKDAATGLLSSEGFHAVTRKSLALCRRMEIPAVMFAIALGDSHREGEDEARVKQLANIIRATFREADVAAHLTVGEFCVLGTKIAESDCSVPLARLSQHVDAANAAAPGEPPLSYRVGVVRYDRDQHNSPDQLIEAARSRTYLMHDMTGAG